MSIGRFHLHKCVAPPPPSGWPNLQHENHVWRCFRPECSEEPEYVCGVWQDAMLEMQQNYVKAGRSRGANGKRNKRGRYVSERVK